MTWLPPRPLPLLPLLLLIGLWSVPSQASQPWDETFTCEAHHQCNGGTCINGECLPAGLPYDGGADAVCGADRRCRIERLAARNQMRRQYNAAQYQQITEEELVRIGGEQTHPNPRLNKPRMFGLAMNTLGVGAYGGWNFNDSFRLHAVLMTGSERVNHTYFEPVLETPVDINERQQLITFGVGISTFLGERTVNPVGLATFYRSSGELGRSWGASSVVGDVTYHFVELGAGLDVQLAAGLHAQLTYNLRWLIHNEAIDSQGRTDDLLRSLLADYMDSRGISGFALTVGLAF